MSHVNAAPRRRERARATRQRIGESAQRLFSANGYAATTMDAIAQDAGVAVQTVYFTFHTKAAVLVEAMKIAGGGPGATAEVMSRDWVHDVLTAPSGGRRLALSVEHGTDIYRRLAPMYRAISAAASVDEQVDVAWKTLVETRRNGMRRITGLMAERGELRADLGPDRAADIMSSVHRPELYLAFTLDSGWSIQAYKAWTYATLAHQLLEHDQRAAALALDSDATADLSFADEFRQLPF
jgi:TetR/AcrR family transcriptional regulator, regulator of autoinduction and epiphytic fitness